MDGHTDLQHSGRQVLQMTSLYLCNSFQYFALHVEFVLDSYRFHEFSYKGIACGKFFAFSNPNKSQGYTQIFSWHTSNRFHNKVWENDYQYIQKDIYPSQEMILKL